jgi:hypothetical protein
MKLGGQASENSASRLATARYDCESAGQSGSEELARRGHTTRLATILEIPVGYQDETGFHCGEPRLDENHLFFEQKINITSTYQF